VAFVNGLRSTKPWIYSFKNKITVKKEARSIIFYLITFPLIIIAHRISPTNLAGPGLDFLLYGPAVVISLFLLIKNAFLYFNVDASLKYSCLIHMAGFIGLLSLLKM